MPGVTTNAKEMVKNKCHVRYFHPNWKAHPYYANVEATTSRTFCCQGWNSSTPATKRPLSVSVLLRFLLLLNCLPPIFPLSPVFLNHHGNVNPTKNVIPTKIVIPTKNVIPLQVLSTLRQLRLQGQIPQNLFQAKLLLLLVHLVPLLQIKVLSTFMFLSSAVFLSANYDACISIAAVFSIYTIQTTILFPYLFIRAMRLS